MLRSLHRLSSSRHVLPASAPDRSALRRSGELALPALRAAAVAALVAATLVAVATVATAYAAAFASGLPGVLAAWSTVVVAAAVAPPLARRALAASSR